MAEAAAQVPGIRKVLRVEAPAYAHPVAEDLAELLVAVAPDYDYLLAPSTTTGKNVMPRVAALLDTAQLSDIVAVLGPDTFQRYIYAGNALATVKSTDAKRVITVRTTAFPAAAAEGGAAEIATVAAVEPAGLATFLGREVSPLRPARPQLGPGGGLGRPRHGLGREFQPSSRASPTRWVPRWAPAARGGRCGLRRQRPPGRPDRQDRGARALRRRRHLRRDPASWPG